MFIYSSVTHLNTGSYGSRPDVTKLIDLQSTNVIDSGDGGDENGSNDDDESGDV